MEAAVLIGAWHFGSVEAKSIPFGARGNPARSWSDCDPDNNQYQRVNVQDRNDCGGVSSIPWYAWLVIALVLLLFFLIVARIFWVKRREIKEAQERMRRSFKRKRKEEEETREEVVEDSPYGPHYDPPKIVVN